MKKYTCLMKRVAQLGDLALMSLLETVGEDERLGALLNLATKAIMRINLEQFDQYCELIMLAGFEQELKGTECLLPDGNDGDYFVHEAETTKGIEHMNSCRSMQKNQVRQLLEKAFDKGWVIPKTVNELNRLANIKKILLTWLLKQSLSKPFDDDCLWTFGVFLFRELKCGQTDEQMFLNVIRDTAGLEECTEAQLRKMVLWLTGANSQLRGDFGNRVIQTTATAWYRKLSTHESVLLVGVFNSVTACSRCTWPAVQVFAGRIQLLDHECRRLVSALDLELKKTSSECKVSFSYDYEGTSVVLLVEFPGDFLNPEKEHSVKEKVCIFWDTWSWTKDVHPILPITVKVGNTVFTLNSAEAKK